MDKDSKLIAEAYSALKEDFPWEHPSDRDLAYTGTKQTKGKLVPKTLFAAIHGILDRAWHEVYNLEQEGGLPGDPELLDAAKKGLETLLKQQGEIDRSKREFERTSQDVYKMAGSIHAGHG